MIEAGVSVVDITPPAGLAMAGYAARTQPATGAHDPLTIRALVVNDTALVTVDVIGIDAALSLRVRSRCVLSEEAVTIQATHTHGGPVSMPGRLSADANPEFLETLENGLVQAINNAVAARQPAQLYGGNGVDPGYARNRRQVDGPVDHHLPILRIDDAQNKTIAVLTSYACHPVVLAADNVSWTGDYPHYVREALERAYPGAMALFATGCAGDINTGHTAASSLTNEPRAERSFATARVIGDALASSVLDANLTPLSGTHGFGEVHEQVEFLQRELESPERLARQWRGQAANDDSIEHIWAKWADNIMGKNLAPLSARCSALHWCGAQIVAMPGEIFAQTALEIRQSLASTAPLFVLAYADDNPGYIPNRAAYSEGGYEVDEAHRFYGMGATIAPGSAEHLAEAGCKAARTSALVAADNE